jgi:hypothetical protein
VSHVPGTLLGVEPKRRTSVYDAYWRFASERHAIFLRRVDGAPAPWTGDPILREFKFCNVYRASDRVSQFLIRNVAYGERASELPADDVFLRIVLFRLFSRETTWDLLETATGGVRRSTFAVDHLGDLLQQARQRGPIYTSAFILAPEPNAASKHRSHLSVVDAMFKRGALPAALARSKSLRDVYEALLTWPMIGPFLAYQISIDLNYSEHFAFDENDFTVPGPGALRGLRKVFSDFGDRTPAQLVDLMVESQEREFERLGLRFDGLFGRRLHAIDCQGLFCEVDKYSRAAFPELKSERVRIKHRFSPSAHPLELFYPPKWAINSKLPRQRHAAASQPSLALEP